MLDDLSIDLSNLEIAEVEVLSQEGKGLPEFAASSGPPSGCPWCSCSVRELDNPG
ncbi:MAG: hypothetical protein AAGM22_28095 [Acidobacteriota bacterium]